MTVFTGLDIHKESYHATVLDEDGETLRQERFPNSLGEVKSFFSDFDDGKVALEASYFWEPVYDELEEMGFEVKLAHPRKTRVIADEKIKTDMKASEALAQLIRMGWLPEAWAPSKETRRIREKLRRRAYLVWKRTGFKNKIEADLAKRGIRRGFTYSEDDREWLRSLEMDSVNDYLDIIEALN